MNETTATANVPPALLALKEEARQALAEARRGPGDLAAREAADRHWQALHEAVCRALGADLAPFARLERPAAWTHEARRFYAAVELPGHRTVSALFTTSGRTWIHTPWSAASPEDGPLSGRGAPAWWLTYTEGRSEVFTHSLGAALVLAEIRTPPAEAPAAGAERFDPNV
jgi:hypothetical protein